VEIELLIKEAFNGVVLGKGYSLRDMEEMDNWGERGPDEDLLAFSDVEIRDDWSALSIETLDRYPSLAHVDALGFRYYIPAFMLSVFTEYQPSDMRFISMLSALYPKRDGLADYTISRYALLNQKQHSAIACYLDKLPSLVMLDFGDSKCVERAMRNYWHEFLPRQ
jgi:hypothetical protein